MNSEEKILNPEVITTDDIFEKLRRSQSFHDMAGIEKALITVPIRRPHPQHFIMVHPSHEWSVPAALLEDPETRDFYYVESHLIPALTDELSLRRLVAAINRQGDFFIWPLNLDKNPDKPNKWNESAAKCAELATKKWIRVKSNTSIGAYEPHVATAMLPDPVWPEKTFRELVNTAFSSRVIADASHPILKKLRGEI